MYSPEEVAHALTVLERLGTYEGTSRETGISRAAIRSWAETPPNSTRRQRRAGTCFRCGTYRFPIAAATEFAYSYLLGLYLGDGHLAQHRRGVYGLRIFLDRSYPIIVRECEAAMAVLMPRNRVRTVRSGQCSMDIPSAYSRHWPCLFPQHGPGMKHQRPIELDAWQREILDQYPGRFLRGLVHSDGYRGINTIRHPKKTYRYPRYEFSNRSDDIRGLFCEYCDKLGVHWTRMNRWTISVARRDSVAILDRHIGPKR